MGWPETWEDYVPLIGELQLPEFCALIKAYRNEQPAGEKHHFRYIDKLAKACSPMTIDYTPVGRMFYQGAPRLLAAGVQVLPFIQNEHSRKAVEGYPALIARRLIDKQPYKSDTKKLQNSARQAARKELVSKLASQFLAEEFGITIDLAGYAQTLVNDPTGDTLDAVLCLIQAAWAAQMKTIGHSKYGIPNIPEAQEGWIADPKMWQMAHEKGLIPAL